MAHDTNNVDLVVCVDDLLLQRRNPHVVENGRRGKPAEPVKSAATKYHSNRGSVCGKNLTVDFCFGHFLYTPNWSVIISEFS